MKKSICFFFVIFLFFTLNAYTDVLPAVISSDLTLLPGIHTISNSTVVQPGVTLTFSPVSTLQFVNVDSKLIVYGSLNAESTTFTGDTPADKWGQILCEPGSDCILLNCLINNGGGDALPPVSLSNAMLFATGANIIISNTIAANPQGDCFSFQGGNVIFNDNTAIACNHGYGNYSAVAIYGTTNYSTIWQSSGNVLTGGTRQGIWLQGDFAKDLCISAKDTRLNVDKLKIYNCTFTILPGTKLGFYDYTPGSLTLSNATLKAVGSAISPIVFSNYYGKNPWTIKLLSGAKAYFDYADIYLASSFFMSNAYICISNTFFTKLQTGLNVNYESEICAYKTTFSGMVSPGVQIRNSSSAILRECSFVNNNPPYMSALYTDESSLTDARYCWWDAADGPYPYGDYNNERINTNGNVMAFPWLLAPPGSQTNPPAISITSHSEEPIVVSTPQILLKGVVTDDSKITRVEFQNLNRKIIGEAFVSGTNWEANVWLFTDRNYIGITAYDDEGNATVLGTIVDCTGDGCGDDSEVAPLYIPLADRTIPVGKLFELAVSAVSQTEPAILSYWASNLPEDALFDTTVPKFSWLPTIEGIYSNITFCVTDGTRVSSNVITITVTSNQTVNILTVNLPDAYVGYPYYFHFSDDSVDGLSSWEFDKTTLSPGLFLSRAGILCGTPYNVTVSRTVYFSGKATGANGIESETKNFVLNVVAEQPPELFKIYTQEIPYKLNGAEYNEQLIATNGAAPYCWADVGGLINNSCGLNLSSNGLLSGTANASGIMPATFYVNDGSNKSTYAKLPIPIIKSEDKLLTLEPGLNKCKIIIKRIPGKTMKCKMIVSVMIKTPAEFDFDADTIATLKAGYGFIDGQSPSFKFIPGVKLLYKKKEGFQLNKILVKKLPDGRIKAKFLLKNVDYNNSFNDFGVLDEDVTAGNVEMPFWIRIGDYCTETTTITLTVKSKTGKFTKCNAKW